MLAYDRAGDGHYDTVSAFIKSLRGNDPDGALYWLASMVAAGEDPRFIVRRLIISASEDVGNADPRALQIAVAAAAGARPHRAARGAVRPGPGDDLHRHGAEVEPRRAPPTGRRSRTSSRAGLAARPDAPAERGRPADEARTASASATAIPHEFEGADVDQQYLPDSSVERRYYLPNDQGYEATIAASGWPLARRPATRRASRGRTPREPDPGARRSTR